MPGHSSDISNMSAHEFQKSPYDRLGGEQGLRLLVERFYELMDTLPEAQTIRNLHADDLSDSVEKLFMFLSGWLGGPSLYIEKFGHPKLRARHLLAPIGVQESDQWLLCMNRAMQDLDIEPKLQKQLSDAFARTADHMRNTDVDQIQ